MLAGIDWTWESFPEYLATVDRLPKAINYGAYIGHSALRMYVMGKRALSEKATEDDLARMAAAVKEAMRAGAMGFSSSRAPTHVTPGRHAGGQPDRRLVGGRSPGRRHGGAERRHLPDRPGHLGRRGAARFLARLKQVAVETGRPVMFGTISSRQGKAEPVDLSARVPGRLRRRRRAHVGPDHHPLDQRHLLAQVLPAVRRVAGVAGAAARCRSPSRSAASPTPPRAGSWSRTRRR